MVHRDLEAGYISPQAAEAEYGMKISNGKT